jgi:hypothetical protein
MLRDIPFGDTEEIGDEYHEGKEYQRYRNAYPQVMDKPGVYKNQDSTDAPACENGAVGVSIEFNESHTSPLIAR